MSVTGHPQSPPLDGYDTDASTVPPADTTTANESAKIDDEDPVTLIVPQLAKRICLNARNNQDPTNSSSIKAVWCLRELMTFIEHDLEMVFEDDSFRQAAQCFTRLLDEGGAAWVKLFPQHRPPPPLARTYAEAAAETTQEELQTHKNKGKGKALAGAETPPSNNPPNRPSQGPGKGKGKGPAKATPPSAIPPSNNPPTINMSRSRGISCGPKQGTKCKPGSMCRWIEEDNRGIRILGWLLQEDRGVGKLASLLVIYMAKEADRTRGLRMGRRLFRTTAYDWKR
ncbi:hypothetical protein BGX38DRAFT_1270860 [Terfezia claveryi]|nr:hypothetical protein BGX38DRAFT_1270860 [Terfezia claveryi]